MDFHAKCIKSVGSPPTCYKCGSYIIKYGKSDQNKQRYYCKNCKCTQVEKYSYSAFEPQINPNIIALTKEGCGIRSTARLLSISATTLISRIKKIASKLIQPPITIGKTHEVDELRTYVRKKEKLIWVVSAFERESGKIVAFNIGRRTNKTLKTVIDTLLNAASKAIYTDKLENYKYLIDKAIHKTRPRGTNRIERAHLSMRTHLKRLNRKTIAFSKNVVMLNAVLKIYFWG